MAGRKVKGLVDVMGEVKREDDDGKKKGERGESWL